MKQVIEEMSWNITSVYTEKEKYTGCLHYIYTACFFQCESFLYMTTAMFISIFYYLLSFSGEKKEISRQM